jgi:DNA-binding response OmpR family regulator
MPGILLVEDNSDLREMLREALLKRKFSVFEASDGKEAINKFKPLFTDLVITDLIMPEEDGLKVIMKLREIKPELKIIAISGGGKAGPGSYLSLAKALGADEVFTKPFPVNTLVSKIDELLQNTGRQ